MKAQRKFVIGSAIIVATLVSLAYVGYTESKTYYHTISELVTLQGSAAHQRMRVSGNVRAGSIAHRVGRVDFVLEESGLVGQRHHSRFDLADAGLGREPRRAVRRDRNLANVVVRQPSLSLSIAPVFSVETNGPSCRAEPDHVIRTGEEIIVMGFELTDRPIEPRLILVDRANRFVRELG